MVVCNLQGVVVWLWIEHTVQMNIISNHCKKIAV